MTNKEHDKINEKLKLIDKRLYMSTSITNLDAPIYDFTACNDIEFLREQLKAANKKIKALEKELNGCCWACSNAKPFEKFADKFPDVSICEHRKNPGGGNMRGCEMWEFNEGEFAEYGDR